MQTIGEKIEETRKRKGISLSEAAEATKIRKDFLLNIESNEYNYDLPDIYKRGFIKCYAKYLKLNPDKVLSQYQEQLITQSRIAKRPTSDFFSSKADLGPVPDQISLDPILEKPSLGEISLNKPTEALEESTTTEDTQINKDLFTKTGILALCTLLFVLGAFWLIKTISQSINKDTEVAVNNPGIVSTSLIADSNEPKPIVEYPITEITLKTSGPVYVQVRQKSDNKILFSKSLIEGEIQTIKRRGPVDVAFTKGDFIRLISNNNVGPIRPKTSSAGTITLP